MTPALKLKPLNKSDDEYKKPRISYRYHIDVKKKQGNKKKKKKKNLRNKRLSTCSVPKLINHYEDSNLKNIYIAITKMN